MEFSMITVTDFFSFSVFWFLFAASCFLLELSIPGFFYFLSCSISGLLLSGIMYAVPILPVFYQLLLFVVFFTLSFFLLKQVAYKTEKEIHAYKSHLDLMIGKEGIVIAEVSSSVPGQVKIHNDVWLSYAAEKNVVIKKGTSVFIVGIRGVHVVVKEKK